MLGYESEVKVIFFWLMPDCDGGGPSSALDAVVVALDCHLRWSGSESEAGKEDGDGDGDCWKAALVIRRRRNEGARALRLRDIGSIVTVG